VSYKSVICYGVLAKKEASYASTGSTFSTTTTDSVQTSELPVINISYVYDGARPNSPSTAGALPYVAPAGRFSEVNLVMEARGSGSAYASSATTPPDVHALLLSCGLTGSYSASQEWVYSPVGPCDTGESVALKLYARGEIYTVIGGRSTFQLASDNASPAQYTFDIQGLMSGSVVDDNVASITYSTVLPPKTDDINLVMGTFSTAIVRSFNLTYGREITPRVNINTTDAHSGFAGGRRDMTFTVNIETPDESDFDIYSLQENGTQFAVTFTIGSTTGNKITVTLPNCQIIGISNGEDGAVSTSELTIKPSSLSGANDIVIKYS